MTTSPEIKHGTDSGYSNGKCRCGPCRAAHAASQRAWIKSRKPYEFNAEDPHGEVRMYGRGCRCRSCLDAWRDYYRARKARMVH